MASKENEVINGGESEGDSLSSLKVITAEAAKAKRGVSQRTFSTSEVDREEKRSAKIVAEFLSLSPVVNSPSSRHAPLLSLGSEATAKDTPVQEMAEMKLNAVCKKKASRNVTPSSMYYSPPVRHRPNDLPQMSRPRSRSLPACSEAERTMRKYLTDKEEDMAKLVGGRLSDIANQIDPNSVPYHKIERILFEAFTLAMSQTGYHVVPVQVFRHALEMVKRQTSGWTYRSILDMLFYGRKIFTQFLINFEGNDVDELKLINQFVDFFNVHCLPWIRSHGGWGEVLHHTEDENDLSSTLDVDYEGDQSSDIVCTGQQADEGLDECPSVTPTVFSSDSDDDSSTLPVLEPAGPLMRHNTPARQLSDIPEVENTSSHETSEEAPDDVPTLMPPAADQHDSDSTTTSSSNLLFYGTTIAVAGALIYNKLN